MTLTVSSRFIDRGESRCFSLAAIFPLNKQDGWEHSSVKKFRIPQIPDLPIRPINFQLSVFQAARREQRLSLAIGGCPSVTLTRV